MERKFQVFLSSTYIDLIEERREVLQALLELDCIPIGMELFQAGDEDQWSYIQKVIDSCDYYILIIGGRYGSINKDGVSYTQQEYEYALKKGIPTLAFIHEDISKLPLEKVDVDSESKIKLSSFKEKVKEKMCRFWNTKDNLKSKVSTGVYKLLKEKPRTGWIRADLDYSDVGKYISYFTPRRNEFNPIFEKTLMDAKRGDKIDIIGISQRLLFTDYPGIDTFIEKIKNGCNFRILLLHPDSLLTEIIQNLSKDYGFSDLRKNVLYIINGVLRELHDELSNNVADLLGSFEIRLYKDVFSTLSYHSVNDKVLLGLYYSHISGTHCPTFELNDKKTRDEAKRHFKKLWEKSKNDILIKSKKNEISDNLDLFLDSNFDFNYFENGISKGISNYQPYQWLKDKFTHQANKIINISNIPTSGLILDYGCAKGFLVKAFKDINYEAYGCDISKYAITNVHPQVKETCFRIKENDLPQELKDKVFDLTLFMHVLEHVKLDDMKNILTKVREVTKEIYIEVPLGDGKKYNNSRHENDKTHIHKNSAEWWSKLLTDLNYSINSLNIINDDYAEIYCKNNDFISKSQ